MQVRLHSPDITCEHCIETISRAVAATEGASFVEGDPGNGIFTIEVSAGAVLDTVASALLDEGYTLGDIPAEGGSHPGPAVDIGSWVPSDYRVERSEVGANVNYDCYCGCDAGFALDRSQADQPTESCCCGNHIFVGPDAGTRITSKLDDADHYRVDVQQVTMPWGQPVEVALAIPSE